MHLDKIFTLSSAYPQFYNSELLVNYLNTDFRAMKNHAQQLILSD
jgi:hypothetical protein